MPIIDIREHGGTYAAGKYRKGGEYTDEQVKLVTTKGNGKPYWENNQYQPTRVAALPSAVYAVQGGSVYKYDQNGAWITTFYTAAQSGNNITDIDANDNYLVICDGTNTYGGLRFFNSSGTLLWAKQSDSSPYFYTSAQAVDINDNGEVVFGTGWSGGGAKNVHKIAANGGVIWSGSVFSGAVMNRPLTHLPNGGAAVVDTTNQIEIINSSGQVVRTFNPGAGNIQCLAADSDGYIYAVVIDSGSPYNVYVRKIEPTNYTVIKEKIIGSSSYVVNRIIVKGSYVYTAAVGNVVKLLKDDLSIVNIYPQPEAVNQAGIFVDSNKDLYLANAYKLRKLDPKQYYTLT